MWLIWRPHERLTANAACTGAGSVRLFSNKVYAERARRADLLADFYATAADIKYKNDADRDAAMWIKTASGEWRLRDSATFTSDKICELLDSHGVEHSHGSVAIQEVGGGWGATKPGPTKLFVAVTVTCCDEKGCSTNGPQFKISDNKAVVDAWLNRELSEELEVAVGKLGDKFYKKYFADNPNWIEGYFYSKTGAEVEYLRFTRIAHKADGHVCPYWWDVQQVTVDGTDTKSSASTGSGVDSSSNSSNSSNSSSSSSSRKKHC